MNTAIKIGKVQQEIPTTSILCHDIEQTALSIAAGYFLLCISLKMIQHSQL